MSKSEEEQPTRGFKVEDRRRFTPDASDQPSEQPADRQEGRAAAVDDRRDTTGQGSGSAPIEMSFSTFLISLSTQALMHLGEVADPVHGEVVHDLPAAKQMIDLLGILSVKTKGNLDTAEAQLLESMLYDLRLRYVEVTRRG